MSDNNEPLDLQKIEARLTGSMLAGLKIECFRVSYDDDILIGYAKDPTTPTSFEIMTSYSEDFFRNAPTDIIALIAEVKRLRREINQRWKYDREAFSMTGLFFPPYPDEVEE